MTETKYVLLNNDVVRLAPAAPPTHITDQTQRTHHQGTALPMRGGLRVPRGGWSRAAAGINSRGMSATSNRIRQESKAFGTPVHVEPAPCREQDPARPREKVH